MTQRKEIESEGMEASELGRWEGKRQRNVIEGRAVDRDSLVSTWSHRQVGRYEL